MLAQQLLSKLMCRQQHFLPLHHKCKIRIYFPPGAKGATQVLNSTISKHSKSNLVTIGQYLPQKFQVQNNVLEWGAPYAYWKIVVEGTICTMDMKINTSNDDIFIEV
jgi:hypothetical protein